MTCRKCGGISVGHSQLHQGVVSMKKVVGVSTLTVGMILVFEVS